MNSKRKNIAKEPSETYEASQKINSDSEELHPILVKLLEKSIEQAGKGEFFTTDEVLKKSREKYPFLK